MEMLPCSFISVESVTPKIIMWFPLLSSEVRRVKDLLDARGPSMLDVQLYE